MAFPVAAVGARRRPLSLHAPAAIPSSEYFAEAHPVTMNGTGTRYFASDTRGTIFQDTAAVITDPITPTATLKPVQ